MESLRLCHPLSLIAKYTSQTPKTIKVGDQTVIIPAQTTIEINLNALHTNPRHWGDDPMKWNPEHFITSPSGSKEIEQEQLLTDTAPHFVPWAYGQRVCPGKRFSQVELVATLATLFHHHRVVPEREGQETLDQALKRAMRTSLNVEQKLLAEMREPESLGLRWVKKV